MTHEEWQETLEDRKVTYTIEVDGKLVAIANVPARVNTETGEQLFAPETVERLQKMLWEQKQPNRIIPVPVYEFT
jgi:YgiT-type zinc finger domain-containing protein